MAKSEAKSLKKLYFTLLQEIATKMFTIQLALWYIFRNILQKDQMLDILIIFVKNLYFFKLRRNQFLKNIFETTFTLHWEHCRWNAWNYSVDYRRRSKTLAACKAKFLVRIVRNFQPLTIVIKNSILDAVAPKLYVVLICFCFKWFVQNIMFMYIRSIQKFLLNSNSYKIRKSTELHWKPTDMVSTW